jgi:hypothetical protein
MIVITAAVLIFRSGRDPSPVSFQPTAREAPATPAAPEPSAPAPIVEQSESANGPWYVVAATYIQKKDAERRAQSIRSRWPRFKAEVFSPPLESEKSYYLVIIGSNLSQKAAVAVRQRAIAAGMPVDTYIQRSKP